MNDSECVELLKWALPRLGLRWPGFRKVRRQVCRRITRRLAELGLGGAAAYRAWLDGHPEEWQVLDGACRVTISRFWRDRGLWQQLSEQVLPELAEPARNRGDAELRAWSVGCASGEEPYSLRLAWAGQRDAGRHGLPLVVVATDADESLLARAREAYYPASSLRELPEGQREASFERAGRQWRLREPWRDVTFLEQDVRAELPPGLFHLVLCRNLAFTYFDTTTQSRVLAAITGRLRPGGALVIGAHERLPEEKSELKVWSPARGVYRWLGAR